MTYAPRDVRLYLRAARPWSLLLLGFMGCSGSAAPPPAVNPNASPPPWEAPRVLDEPLGAEELMELEVDESLRAKILRTHPDLRPLDALYTEAIGQYAQRDLDAAEENFLLLKARLEEPTAEVDSLTLRYLHSLEYKLEHFADILMEERFFSDSYAAVDVSLDDVFDSLRVAYAIPAPKQAVEAEPVDAFELELAQVENDKVERWIRYFTGNGRERFGRWLQRKQSIGLVLQEILEDESLPRDFIYLSMIESGISPQARSRASAVGYWQFVAGTARNRGLTVDAWLDERRDPVRATRAAARHLKLLHRMFQNWPLSLAAYNAGEYRILRAIGLQSHADYWDLRLPRETREYVPKFIAALRIGRNPEQYGFELPPQNPVRFEELTVDGAFSLDQIAKATGASESALRSLNPQLVAGITPGNRGPYALRVPPGSSADATATLAAIPASQRVSWEKHRVRRGETLGAIASRYGTSVRALQDLNGIRNPRRLRPGQQLTIPTRGQRGSASRAVAAGASSYRVRPGDTLSHIARRTGVSARQIRSLNGLQNDRIVAGQVLRLKPGAAASSGNGSVRYTVRRGDTLHDIGVAHGVTVRQLMSWNNLKSASRIFPGDVLEIRGSSRAGTR